MLSTNFHGLNGNHSINVYIIFIIRILPTVTLMKLVCRLYNFTMNLSMKQWYFLFISYNLLHILLLIIFIAILNTIILNNISVERSIKSAK